MTRADDEGRPGCGDAGAVACGNADLRPPCDRQVRARYVPKRM